MPFVETRFISPTALTTSAASALYTVPTGYSAIIKQLVVTNTTGTAATFTFYIGTASAGNALFSGTSVAANDTVIINLSQVLTTGETLRALASTGSALNLTVSGVLNDGPLASTATVIVDNAVTTNKIAAGAVTSAKLAGSLALTGTPTAPTAAAGTNTTQLATTAFVTTASLGVTSGFRNVLINGAFDIWQRGTSFSTTAGTRTFIADRWYVVPSGGSLAGVSRNTTNPGAFGTYSAYSLVLIGNTNVTTCLLGQRIEAANMPSLRRTVTFSARILNFTGASFNPSLILSTPNAEDNFSSVTAQSTNALGTAASNSWTTVTWTGDISGYTNITNGLQVEIQIPSGSLDSNSKFLAITEVQLEKGSVATPFARRNVGEELLLCQRYYWRTIDSQAYGLIMSGGVEATTSAAVGCVLPVTMRATPSMALGSGIRFYSAGSSVVVPTINAQRSSASFGSAALNITSGTVGQAGYLYNIPLANSYIEFGCEL